MLIRNASTEARLMLAETGEGIHWSSPGGILEVVKASGEVTAGQVPFPAQPCVAAVPSPSGSAGALLALACWLIDTVSGASGPPSSSHGTSWPSTCEQEVPDRAACPVQSPRHEVSKQEAKSSPLLGVNT